jgi:hypothetical protein
MRTHTGPRFIVSSEGRESHQSQVIRASHTNSKILVPEPGREPAKLFLTESSYTLYVVRVLMLNVGRLCLRGRI